jgi:hypothetical protein
MALQLGILRDALAEAGASPESARKAAEEVAGYEKRLSGVETRLAVLDSKVDRLAWMAGVNIALTLPILGKTFSA